jgi:hypothetical protein
MIDTIIFMAILLSKHFAFDINFNFSDKTGRLLTCEINTKNAMFHIFNIYAPNLKIETIFPKTIIF